MHRRDALALSAGACLAAGAAEVPARLKLKHSVVGWCFRSHGEKWDIDTLCQKAKAAGCASVELVGPEDWPALARHGMSCAIGPSGTAQSFMRAWNNKALHAELLAKSTAMLDKCAAQGIKSSIGFVGFQYRDAGNPKSGVIPRDEAARSCVEGWKMLARHAEKVGVTVCIEHLNSRVSDHPMKGHPGYQGDDIDWVASLVRQVDSPRLKILFDVYHVQVMHGDLVRRLEALKDVIGHVHTAGNPGRGELDSNQEIGYAAIGRALNRLGYQGWVGHEFIPTRDPAAGLAEAVRTMEA